MRGHVPAPGAVGAHHGQGAAVLAGATPDAVVLVRQEVRRGRGEHIQFPLGGRAEQGLPGPGQVGDPPRGHAEPQGGARVGVTHGVRDGGDSQRFGLGGPAGAGAALLPGEQARDNGQAQQERQGDAEAAQPPGRAYLAAPGTVAGLDGDGEERVLQVGEFRGLPKGLPGRGELCSAEQCAFVPAQSLPDAGGVGEPAVQAQPLAVLLDPATQPGPAEDQCLVGEVDGGGVGGEQARTYELFQDQCRARGRPQLVPGGGAPGVLGTVTG